MSTRSPSPVLAALISAAILFSSTFLGSALAEQMAPDSRIAAILGFVMLPAAFLVGLQIWMGAAIIAFVFGRLSNSDRNRRDRRPPEHSEGRRETRAGAYVFAIICPMATTVAGFLTALLSDSHGFFTIIATYTLVGTIFGIAVWILAKYGYIELLETY